MYVRILFVRHIIYNIAPINKQQKGATGWDTPFTKYKQYINLDWKSKDYFKIFKRLLKSNRASASGNLLIAIFTVASAACDNPNFSARVGF